MRDAGNISNPLFTQIHRFLAVSDSLAVADLGPTLKQGQSTCNTRAASCPRHRFILSAGILGLGKRLLTLSLAKSS